MKAVAKLSGGEDEVHPRGLTHITGGDFEFHEVALPDTSGINRVLEDVR